MKQIFSMVFCGEIEHVNYDRNGAHLRLNLLEKKDLLNNVEVSTEHKASLSLPYWNGYDYEKKLSDQIRSLVKGDVVTITINRYKGFLGREEEEISIRNYTLETYEALEKSDDLR